MLHKRSVTNRSRRTSRYFSHMNCVHAASSYIPHGARPLAKKRFSRSPRSDEHLFKPIRAYLAAKLPPTLWRQPPARAARGCAAGGSRRLPRRHPTGSPCTWRVATLATPSAGCNQQVRAGRNGSAPIRCPGTSIHLSAVVVRVRGAGRRGLLLCINNVTTPPAS